MKQIRHIHNSYGRKFLKSHVFSLGFDFCEFLGLVVSVPDFSLINGLLKINLASNYLGDEKFS